MLKNQQSQNAELLEAVIRFVMKMCLLYQIDLKGKKEVVEEVQEGDKAHCGKRKLAKEEDTNSK